MAPTQFSQDGCAALPTHVRLIISGVPCCGKTHFGDWLRDQHGHTHVNLEGRRTATGVVEAPHMYGTLPRWVALLASDVVATWGFPPNSQCIAIVQQFRELGFTPWWFAASYDIARQRYIAREGQQAAQQLFDPQVARLQEAKPQLDALYVDHSVETLTANGYAPEEQIYGIITANVA